MTQPTLDPRVVWTGMPDSPPTLQRPGVWLAGIQLILAYEWLVSGLNKLFASRFDAGLLATLQDSTHTNPYTWYTAVLQRVVIPNHTFFAFVTPLGEMAIGLALTAGTALWLLRLSPRATMCAGSTLGAALLGSAFLSLNYFFQGGTTLPWINTSKAFSEGVDIDILIPLVSLVLLAACLQVLLTARSGTREATSPKQTLGAHRSAAFTLIAEGKRTTLKSLLGERVNESEIWVDVQGLCWTAWELLEKSPPDLLSQRIISVGMSVDAEGHGSLRDLNAIDQMSGHEDTSSAFDLIRLRYRNGTLGPVLFVVAGEDQDPHVGVMALSGPIGQFLDLRSPSPLDIPEWPLPSAVHAPFSASDQRESPESA